MAKIGGLTMMVRWWSEGRREPAVRVLSPGSSRVAEDHSGFGFGMDCFYLDRGVTAIPRAVRGESRLSRCAAVSYRGGFSAAS